MEEQQVISKFDRAFGGLMGDNVFRTKPTTIETTAITGESETFIVQTIRNEAGDHIVVKFLDKSGVVRLILPPKVAKVIAFQRESLTTRRRSAASKDAMKRRMDKGFVPTFAKKPKKQRKTTS